MSFSMFRVLHRPIYMYLLLMGIRVPDPYSMAVWIRIRNRKYGSGSMVRTARDSSIDETRQLYLRRNDKKRVDWLSSIPVPSFSSSIVFSLKLINMIVEN